MGDLCTSCVLPYGSTSVSLAAGTSMRRASRGYSVADSHNPGFFQSNCTCGSNGCWCVLTYGLSSCAVRVFDLQAAVLKRLGELQVVDTTCPSSAIDKNGLITVPSRPDKLSCSFRVADLPPMAGTATPLVYLTGSSVSPLPAETAYYKTAGASRVPVGECAVLGASRSLKKQGASSAVEGQPVSKADSALPAQPVCTDFSTTFDMTFGPFGATQCGSYQFSGSVSATPVANTGAAEGLEGARPARADLTFGVDVTGCPSSTRAANAGRNSNARGSAGAPASSLRGL